MQLPRSLESDSNHRAVTLLRAYYARLSGQKTGYTGGQFDAFDPSGTRSASANTFTSDDLLSLSLLSAPMPGRATHELLVRQRRRFEVLLENLGADRDLVGEASVTKDDFAPAWELWRALHALPDLGPTRVSKLMARKRPRLIPIFDDVLSATVFAGSTDHWDDLWHELREPEAALHERLLQVREDARLDESISPLRVFDVCAWMDGTKYGDLESSSVAADPMTPTFSTEDER